MNIEFSPTLARIRAAGILRVGTTGDYTPFSLKRPDGLYEGADIDMAHDLAATLGVRVQFVPTVWVDLLRDFLADRFDTAMGGVTVNEAGAASAFFRRSRDARATAARRRSWATRARSAR